MNFKGKVGILGLAVLLALATGALAQSQQLAWDGTQWKEFNQEIKVAYVKGVLNMASFETELLNYVIEHGTIKYSELAKKFKKTSPGIYAAIKRLRHKKILLGLYPKIDLSKFGYDFTAFIFAKIDQKK